MTLSENLLLQHLSITFSFALEIVKQSLERFLKSESTAPLVLRMINLAILSTYLLIALLSVVLIILNTALFHSFRQD